MTEGERIPTILAKLEGLENSVERVENLIKQEISELKTEQIAELRKLIEKYVDDTSKAIDRIADDQRRAWDAIRALENDHNRARGGGKVLSGLVTGVIAIISSSAAAVFITKFLK